MLRLRVLTGVVGVPVLAAATVFGGLPYLLCVVVPAVIGTLELTSMAQAAGGRPLPLISAALAVAFVGEAAMPGQGLLLIALALAVVASLLTLMAREDWTGAIGDWSGSLAAPAYVGGLLQFYVPLRAMPDGVLLVCLVLGCTFLSDTAAFFVGRRFGRTRLAPRVSPGKSVEGAVAGVVVATAAALLTGIAVGSWLHLAGLGLVIGLCAVAGDLLESFLKRQFGAKDSGTIVPGHGGLLDRMDSLLVAVAGAYMYIVATR
ncbi:MAG: phosphatidate cytidylyltransferase [Chloroflexota bacterium]